MAGLAVFLFALDQAVTGIVAGIGGFLCIAYMVANTLPIFSIGCPYRTPLTALLYSFVYGPGRILLNICKGILTFPLKLCFLIPYISAHHTLQPNGLLQKTQRWFLTFSAFRFSPPQAKSLRHAERMDVNANENQWVKSALSWLASTTSDPSAKIILVGALGTLGPLLDVEPLVPIFEQEWSNITFLDNEPGTYDNEMLLGRLIGSTVSQLNYWNQNLNLIMLRLPSTPIWVKDPALILAIAACHRTSIFNWKSNGPVVLRPSKALTFALEHYTVFEEVLVPMWMWLSICMQEALRHDPRGGVDLVTLLVSVSTWGTCNTLAERYEILVWLNQLSMPGVLQRALHKKIADLGHYDRYTSFAGGSRYKTISLTTFLAVIKSGRSLDTYRSIPELKPPSLSPSKSGILVFPRSSTSASSSLDSFHADPEHRAPLAPQPSQAWPGTSLPLSLLPTHYSPSPSTRRRPSSGLTEAPTLRPLSIDYLYALAGSMEAHSDVHPPDSPSSINSNDSSEGPLSPHSGSFHLVSTSPEFPDKE
ncbi:hypothetical protein K438DRAFT_1991647 [Mycena galopus ATCC 62051]|nr:hypothetical protein K438DRAFT_1991647 [Mycena galopus ATCC 62051]